MANDERKPLTVRREVVERTEFPNGNIMLENIVIDRKTYDVGVYNQRNRLILRFYEAGRGERVNMNNASAGEYAIHVTENGIRFERYLHRPKHDHDDIEELLVGANENVPGIKLGELRWQKNSPSVNGTETFYVPFGNKIDLCD